MILVFVAVACGSDDEDSSSVAQVSVSSELPGGNEPQGATDEPAATAPSDSVVGPDSPSPSNPDPAETYALADVVFEYLVPPGNSPAEVASALEDSENSASIPADVQGSLVDFVGQPLVVNFWGSWCAPCAREMPEFEAVHQAFKGEVAFLGMNVQDEPANALNLATQTGVTYPLSKDPQGNIQLDFSIISLPATLFISPEGEELDRWVGILDDAALAGLIETNFEPFLASST